MPICLDPLSLHLLQVPDPPAGHRTGRVKLLNDGFDSQPQSKGMPVGPQKTADSWDQPRRSPPATARRHYRAARLSVVAIALVATLSGCRSTGVSYNYDELPSRLFAQRRSNARTVDLSKLSRAQGPSNRVEAGDVVEVTIAATLDEDDAVVVPTRINEQGIAQLPLVGPLPVGGLELEAVEAVIAEACIDRGFYRSPHVTVTMKSQRTNRITVVGAVEEPGTYEIPRSQSDLLGALVAAGSLSEEAGTNVEIRNPVSVGGPSGPEPIAGSPDSVNAVGHEVQRASRESNRVFQSVQVDLISATQGGGGGFQLQDGSVVNVERRDPEPVHVRGLVRKPDRYEYPVSENMHVLDAISLAGGESMTVANKVYVIRRDPESNELVIIKTSLGKAKRDSRANLVLAPGDIVSVESTPMTALLETLSIVRFGIGASLPINSLY